MCASVLRLSDGARQWRIALSSKENSKKEMGAVHPFERASLMEIWSTPSVSRGCRTHAPAGRSTPGLCSWLALPSNGINISARTSIKALAVRQLKGVASRSRYTFIYQIPSFKRLVQHSIEFPTLFTVKSDTKIDKKEKKRQQTSNRLIATTQRKSLRFPKEKPVQIFTDAN